MSFLFFVCICDENKVVKQVRKIRIKNKVVSIKSRVVIFARWKRKTERKQILYIRKSENKLRQCVWGLSWRNTPGRRAEVKKRRKGYMKGGKRLLWLGRRAGEEAGEKDGMTWREEIYDMKKETGAGRKIRERISTQRVKDKEGEKGEKRRYTHRERT